MATDYSGWSVEELRAEAAEQDIEGRSSMNKQELINALSGDGDTPSTDTTDTATTADTDEGLDWDARIADRIRAGTTVFTEDEMVVIAEKFGVKDEAHPFGNAHTEENSPTAGTVAAGQPHPSVDEAVTPEALEKNKKK